MANLNNTFTVYDDSGPAHSLPASLGDSDALLFSDPGGNRNHQFPGRSRGAEVLLGKTHELNTVRSKPLDVLKRSGDAFSGQTIECPY